MNPTRRLPLLDLAVNVFRFGAPVCLGALGETLQQKSGVLNIGLEGLMLTAAFTSMLAAKQTSNPWIGLAVGLLAALILALLQGVFVLTWSMDQVVVGTVVNLFALGITSTVFRMIFGASGQLISVPKLPTIFWGLDFVLLLIPIFAVLLAWLFAKTKWGLAVRAAGENPKALSAAGFSPAKVRWMALAGGGLMAGLAGSYYTLGITGSFAEDTIAGRGFIAIAMVTFGRWNPVWVLLASLLVGAAEQVQFSLQTVNQGIPVQFFSILPYVCALVVLIMAGKGTAAPESLGQPWKESK